MNAPLFSLLMANFNNGRFIVNAVESVKKQSYENWELIIVDDASTDNSWEIIQILSRSDKRIRIFRNSKNLKVGATKRLCAEYSNGEICGIIDPDDQLKPNAVAAHVKAHLNNSTCSMIASGMYVCNDKLEIQEKECPTIDSTLDNYLCERPGLVHAFWSFKKEKYRKTEGFKSQYILAEDQDLFYKLEETGPIFLLSQILYYYRIHNRSISKNDKIAISFGYHLLAMFDALNRRAKNKNQRNSIKRHFIEFLKWGIINLSKKNQLKLINRAIYYFPELVLNPHLIRIFYWMVKY